MKKKLLLVAIALGMVFTLGQLNKDDGLTYEESALQSWNIINDIDRDEVLTEYDVPMIYPQSGKRRYAVKAFQYDYKGEQFVAFATTSGKVFAVSDIYGNIKNGKNYVLLADSSDNILGVESARFKFIEKEFFEDNIHFVYASFLENVEKSMMAQK